MKFHGRTDEVAALDELSGRDSASLVILYGRRRIGKTRLLTHWAKSNKTRRSLYWVAEPTSATDQLRLFSQALYNFSNPEAPAPPDFTYASWPQLWEQVAKLADREPFALLLDEFTYLLEANPAVAGILQNSWDHLLKKRRLLLVVSGSHLGMMQRHALGYQAPLYGRAAAQIHLRPLPFGVTRKFFPKYDPAERVAIYSMFGGVPAYWERVDPARSISQNLKRQLLTPNNLMQEEPRLLLHDFLSDTPNYVSVLRAIANNCRTQKEISGHTGLPQGHISKYLDSLRNSGFVERRIPVTETEKSRRGRYHIVDPYLRFYYRFLAARQSQLALGVGDLALKEIQRHLIDFIGTHTWEELCREWTLRAAANGKLSDPPDQVGSLWTTGAQIDVVGLNRMEKTLLLGECKWGTSVSGPNVLRRLTERAEAAIQAAGKNHRWKVAYCGFSRAGWSREAKKLASEIRRSEGVEITLLDLKEIDRDLERWTK
ncbi:MAG: AAA+ ATPase superfamily predicted ATPase [Candidatus Binatia bacterium]|jgi:AAA+ ATPase superfamily predicted ATPase